MTRATTATLLDLGQFEGALPSSESTLVIVFIIKVPTFLRTLTGVKSMAPDLLPPKA